MELWKQNVEELKQSRRARFTLPNGQTYEAGEIDAVVETRLGTLSGNHRKAAGWKSSRTVQVKDDLDFAFKKIQTVVQRRSTETENKELLLELCDALVRHGVPTEKVGTFVIVNALTPWGQQYTDSLMLPKFKRSGGYAPQTRGGSANTSQAYSTPDLGVDKAESARQELIFPCPRCGCPGGH